MTSGYLYMWRWTDLLLAGLQVSQPCNKGGSCVAILSAKTQKADFMWRFKADGIISESIAISQDKSEAPP